jgi:glucose/arabinose dehydrogenase
MGGQRLVLLTIGADGSASDPTDVALQAARYRSLVQGPDGSLYIATDAGQIWRVTPSATETRTTGVN